MKLKKITALAVAFVLVAASAVTVSAEPFKGAPLTIGGGETWIEAEDFDIGGENAYWFPAGKTDDYRSDGFSIRTTPSRDNTYVIDCIAWSFDVWGNPDSPTNYAEYTVDVQKAGTYTIETLVAIAHNNQTAFGGTYVTFAFDGKEVGKTHYPDVTTDDASNWDAFERRSTGEVYLNAGVQLMRVDFSSCMAVDAYVFTLVKEDASAAPADTGSSGSESSSGGKDVPVTGSNNVLPFAACAFLLSVAGVILIIRRYGKVTE